MNPNRRKVLFAYIALIVLMVLFPPTVIETTSQNITIATGITYDSRSASGGFRFIGSIGDSWGTYGATHSLAMDLRQLAIQIIVASLVAAAGYAAFKEEK